MTFWGKQKSENLRHLLPFFEPGLFFMMFPIYPEIFFWGNAWFVLHLSMLTKTMKAMDFTEML